ncbi:hypothetical protein NE237_013879 [Protea cynaroides]|uniref:Cupin type-1 domain-containing protein n=1 Tax=Protea cynaroides TaxID=273540 RepID=A0A9Q0GZH9_9MAGN|nr:hypothetical protein NE237_013879 [Protea cynaroides]
MAEDSFNIDMKRGNDGLVFLPFKYQRTPVPTSPQSIREIYHFFRYQNMANSSLLCLGFFLLVLFHTSLAQLEQQSWRGQRREHQQQRRLREESECRIERLDALEPTHRLEAEAGQVEFWDQNHEQFDCAGVAAARYRIRPRGLLLPSYSNAPRLVYVVQGRGFRGNLIPGCPETFQSSPQSERSEGGRSERDRGHRSRDQHQRIERIRQGDFLAIPHGIAHWIYNDGDEHLELVSFYDTRNHHNQLDRRIRRFFLAGNPQGQERERGSSFRHGDRRGDRYEESWGNVFNGFDTQLLSEAFGVDEETARRLQGENDDNRGAIVHVERGLEVIRPSRGEEEEEREQGERRGRRFENGLEETICNARLRENLENPTRADVYSEQGGRISSLNSHKLPILNYLQLSAERGVLYRNAILAPHWNINAHSVIYVTRGSARVQIVGNRGERAFDEEVREGQILVVPQNFAVAKQANNEGFEWVSFKTNDNAISSQLAGRTSVLRALPEEVLMNAYQIRREEARRIKYGREEAVVLSPRDQGRERLSA